MSGISDKNYSKGDRHVDVHNIIACYSLTKELLIGLAKQILVEFNLCVKSSGSIADSDIVRKDMHILTIATPNE